MYFASRRVGKAVGDYDMLNEGDKVLVAVSGGRDSMALLELLRYRQTIAPIHYDITALHVDLSIPDLAIDSLRDYFVREKISYHIEKVDPLKGKTWEEMDCFTCSRIRRKAFLEMAEKFGCNKIATGHHMDDIAETIVMNLFCRGEIGAMCPKQELFKGKYAIIRPLAYLKQRDVQGFIEADDIFYLKKNKCLKSEDSKRIMLRHMLDDMEKELPAVKKNIIRGLTNIKKDYLIDVFDDEEG